MRPILLEIVTNVITTFDHCRRCNILFNETGIDKTFHRKDIDEYPSDLKEELAKLSNWIRELNHLYKHRLLIKLIDAQSLPGILKSLRYRIRSYPTFIVEGKETYAGWDKIHLETLLDKYIQTSLHPKQRRVQLTLS